MKRSLSAHFARMSAPERMDIVVDSADSLLTVFVNGCDTRGRYPRTTLVRLFWWQISAGIPSSEDLDLWVEDLISRGLIRSDYLYEDIYSGEPVPVLTLLKRGRYSRFIERPPISKTLREAVYERDGHKCVSCGRPERLTLDHVLPYSLGGEDTYENLQTMCVWCNAKKGARI